VPGQQHAHPRGLGEVAKPPERAQVVAEVPVGRDDRGAAAEHGVAGEQDAVRGQQDAHRVRGMTGGRHHPQLASCRHDHVAVGQALGSQAVRRVSGLDRRPAQLGQPGRPGRVIRVPVRQRDLRHPPVARDRLAEHPAQVALVVRPWVDHHDRG
jgi:hypothetical protein